MGRQTGQTFYKSLLIVAVGVFLSACVTAPQLTLTDEQTVYLQKVRSAPLTFTLPNSQVQQARARAEVYVGKASVRGIMIADRNLIESFRPNARRRGYGYRVTFLPGRDGTVVTVFCTAGAGMGTVGGQYWEHNARMLAHYLRTGELMPQFVAP